MSAPDIYIYGNLPPGLTDLPAGARQTSPRAPGASPLGEVAPASSTGIVVHAPASVAERRRVLAMALRALAPGAPLVAVAHNNRGGTRLVKELEAFGCTVTSEHRRHHRIVAGARPHRLTGIDDAIAEGDATFLPDIGLWSQPGLFNWDRVDPGSQLLIEHLPVLSGRGADLGCGIGVLARAVCAGGACTEMHLIDIDARALHMARLNVTGARLIFHWTDVRSPGPAKRDMEQQREAQEPQVGTLPNGLDFVVCNPPFHDGGDEDRSLGQVFITRAGEMLRPGGVLWLTANRHLPYEAVLRATFETVTTVADRAGFKIFSATKTAASSRPAARSAARGDRNRAKVVRR